MYIISGISGSIGRVLFDHYTSIGELAIGTYNNNPPDIDSRDRIYQLDITDFSQVSNFVKQLSPLLKNICLINNAGVTYNAFAHKSDPELWKKVIDTNLTGTYNMIRALLPHMRQQKYGRIINCSSVVAQVGAIGTTAYAASKAGLWGLTKSLSLENAGKNILTNSLNLGYMEMGMTTQIPTELQTEILKRIPAAKFGETQEVILAVDYLVNSNYITGTSIDINGGIY